MWNYGGSQRACNTASSEHWPRQRNLANTAADNSAEYCRRAVYFPLVDNVMADLHSRFIANATLDKLKDISYFVPACCVLQNDSMVNVDSLLIVIIRVLRRELSWRYVVRDCIVAPKVDTSEEWI